MINKVDLFTQQLQVVNRRINQIYEQANTKSLPSVENLLPLAFKELGLVTEELNVATEELIQQNDELESARYTIESERLRYQELFEYAPDAYIVMDANGVVQEANRATSSLLQISPIHLVGKPFSVFVATEDRFKFRSQMSQLQAQDKNQEWLITLCPRKAEPFPAAIKAARVYDQTGTILSWRLTIREVRAREPIFYPTNESCSDTNLYLTTHNFSKGDNIVLDHSCIYWVNKGLVKLSTVSPYGDEVVLGFAGSQIPFGPSLTSLPIYQATAFSKNVEVQSIAVKDIAAVPYLAQHLLPKLSKRLQQTEALLAIAGNRRIQDRLHYLLLLLKDEIGQKVPEGICLEVRLTHQDIASICGTTRVTVTRLLNKFHKEQLIAFDRYSHIILLEKLLKS